MKYIINITIENKEFIRKHKSITLYRYNILFMNNFSIGSCFCYTTLKECLKDVNETLEMQEKQDE